MSQPRWWAGLFIVSLRLLSPVCGSVLSITVLILDKAQKGSNLPKWQRHEIHLWACKWMTDWSIDFITNWKNYLKTHTTYSLCSSHCLAPNPLKLSHLVCISVNSLVEATYNWWSHLLTPSGEHEKSWTAFTSQILADDGFREGFLCPLPLDNSI